MGAMAAVTVLGCAPVGRLAVTAGTDQRHKAILRKTIIVQAVGVTDRAIQPTIVGAPQVVCPTGVAGHRIPRVARVGVAGHTNTADWVADPVIVRVRPGRRRKDDRPARDRSSATLHPDIFPDIA